MKWHPKEEYFVLIDLDHNKGYYSATLAPFKDITGVGTEAMRKWLYRPAIALKRGYYLTRATRLKSKQGGLRANSPVGHHK